MYKNHVIGCGLGVLVALILVRVAGASASSVGVLAAALFCPVVMLGAMWFLVRRNRNPHGEHQEAAAVTPHGEPPLGATPS